MTRTTETLGATVSTGGGGWRSGGCDALGHRFRVVAHDADPILVRRLEVVTGALASDVDTDVVYSLEPAGPGAYSLSRDGEPVCDRRTAETTVRYLAWDVNRCAVAAARQDHVVLHAAAASRNGQAVLLAAPMEHGKTTTVAGLLRAGWDYVTDEAVAVRRADLRVTPFPKALCLDRGSWPILPEGRPGWPGADADEQWHVPASRLGTRAATGTVLPALLVLPAFRAGAATAVRPVGPAAAVTRLAPSTFGFPAGGARDLAVLARLARTRPAYELTVGDLGSAVRLIDDLARRHGVA